MNETLKPIEPQYKISYAIPKAPSASSSTSAGDGAG